jgi:arsenite-transporting ATPase
MVGIPALRALLANDVPGEPGTPFAPVELPSGLASLGDLIDELAAAAHGLVMVTGKGGVGKTTIAAAIAVELASRGVPVHLSTTDPAAHVATTVAGSVEHLDISRIDPAAETRAYTARVLERKNRGLDAAGRALLEEDLRSPCTEEVAVFHAFARVVMQASARFVVLDTAPTGHTLLLLDTTGAYHRELTRAAIESPLGRVVTPLMRLQDPRYTKVIIVTLAETTPVTEATRLQADLRRAGIEPFAWVINSSLAAAGARDPLLRQRITREIEQIGRVQHDLARRVAIVPWMTVEPTGPERLRALARGDMPSVTPARDDQAHQ